MSIRAAIPASFLLAVAIGAAACSSGGAAPAAQSSPGASSPANPTTVPSPSLDGIAHPTGADEVVLRFEDAGGFTPPEWQAARLPYFTLYGDGTIVFVQTTAEVPASADNVFRGQPLRTGKLTEDQVQELITYALTDGGLALAKTEYQNPMVADAPTSIFTINADGDSKTVSAMALGMQSEPGPDTAILNSLAKLAERLRDFDQGGTLASAPYEAPAYRAVILEQQGGAQGVVVRDWPWTDIAPSDFVLPQDAMALQQGTMTLTPGQAAAVGVEGYENGISSGLFIRDDAGKVYSLVIRPLLPDETK
jgi:hypothetical protein